MKPPVFFIGDRFNMREKNKTYNNNKIHIKKILQLLKRQKHEFSQNNEKQGTFQLTVVSVRLNPQKLKELHPTTGYRKGTCFLFISNRFNMREKNKT